MPAHYTQRIENQFDDDQLLLARIRQRVENMPEDATRKQWRELFSRIAHEQTCSARFYLMAWLEEHSDSKTDTAFTFQGISFPRVTEESAFRLSSASSDLFREALVRIASEHTGTPPEEWDHLFNKAFLRNPAPSLLSKEEALEIAHALDFSFEEAKGFLRRALSNDGFDFACADDLIEAFTFYYAPANSSEIAGNLKLFFHESADHLKKSPYEQRPQNFTAQLCGNSDNSIKGLVQQWQSRFSVPDDIIDTFGNWLLERASYLDVPSKTAYLVYRRLAGFAFELVQTNAKDFPEIDPEDIQDVIRVRYSDSKYDLPESVDPYTVSTVIMSDHKQHFEHRIKRYNEFHALTVDCESGSTTIETISNRIPNLLSGKIPVTKADMLFMLFFVLNLLWDPPTEENVYDMVSDFWLLGPEILDYAMLPAFYLPHLTEQSYLQAICDATGSSSAPYEQYADFCNDYFSTLEYRDTAPRKTQEEIKENNQITKKKRRKLERYVLSYFSISKKLRDHFLEYGFPGRRYMFDEHGIRYDPDPAYILTFSNQVGSLFSNSVELSDEEHAELLISRFNMLYSLSVYLSEQAADAGIKCSFRVSYNTNSILRIVSFEYK